MVTVLFISLSFAYCLIEQLFATVVVVKYECNLSLTDKDCLLNIFLVSPLLVNTFASASVRITLPRTEYIPVQFGDYLGWYVGPFVNLPAQIRFVLYCIFV